MTAIFPKWTNKLPPFMALAVVAGGLSVIFVVWYWFSPRHIEVGYQPLQPVLYSHKLHAGLLGIDCRYCHRMVEDGPQASIPDTATCMNCHAQVKADSDQLSLVRESAETGAPIPWIKVHMLPDYVYFDHSVHVTAGVGCVSCHGRIDQMEVVRQEKPLSMSWCLECHINPEPNLRPTSEVTNMGYDHDTAEAKAAAEQILKEKNINPPIHCGACHR